jgi:Domain of unknown function (DUF4386)
MNTNTLALGKLETANRTGNPTYRKMGRIAGVLYLVIIAAGIFAQFFVRGSLVVPGDAATTASNILASKSLFRLGIVSDLVMIMADVAIGLIFYVLLRPVNNSLSLLAAFFRLAQATILGINLLNLFIALQFLSGAGYLAALGTRQAHALALVFLQAHTTGYSLGMVFFGFSILVLGYLISKSGYLPRLLGLLLALASLGYLTDSLASFALPNYTDMFTLVAFVAELALCLWLLVKGVNVPQTREPLGQPA